MFSNRKSREIMGRMQLFLQGNAGERFSPENNRLARRSQAGATYI
jgi:hypothetical protein